MRKIVRQIVSGMLACVLILISLPTKQVYATECFYGLSNPTIDSAGNPVWDCIWFGNYLQEDTNNDGNVDSKDEKQPIKWRVLSVDDGKALLLSDKLLYGGKYNDSGSGVTWEDSSLRTWLRTSFMSAAFGSSEKYSIVNNSNSDETADSIFILSKEDIQNDRYGFISDLSREAKCTKYAQQSDAFHSGELADWWLRDVNSSDSLVLSVDSSGYIYENGSSADLDFMIRPALYIYLGNYCWSSAGKTATNGDILDDSEEKYGIKNPSRSDSGDVTWDCLWFGNYYQNDTNGDNVIDEKDRKLPIKWRVISVQGNDALLMSDKILDIQPYNAEEIQGLKWTESTIRSWLNGYDSNTNTCGISYEGKGFSDIAFSNDEKTAIFDSDLYKSDGRSTRDKLFLLSYEELTKARFSFSREAFNGDVARCAKPSGYAKGKLTLSIYGEYLSYWLRPNSTNDSLYCGVVYSNGDTTNLDGYYSITWTDTGVRPAIHLNLDSSLYSFAGTVCSDGTSNEISDGNVLDENILDIAVDVGKGESIKYSNYDFVTSSQEQQLRVRCRTAKNTAKYQQILREMDDLGIEVNRIHLSLPENGLNFGKTGIFTKTETKEMDIDVNKKILLGDDYVYDYSVYVDDDYEPESKKTVEIEMSVVVSTNMGDYPFTEKIEITNLDFRRQKAEEQKAEREKKNSVSAAKSELQKLCNGNYLALGVDLQYYLQSNQIDQIESYLYCWIAEVNNSQMFTSDRKINNKIMEKLGINPNVGFLWTNTEAVTSIQANTVYGEKTIEFTLRCGNLNSNGNSYCSFGDIRYEIKEKDNIPKSVPTEGLLGITTFVSMKKFNECMKEVAEWSVKNAYGEIWGNGANEVASLIVDETIMKVIDKKYGSFSNGVYTLFTEPTKNYIKKVKIDCPVDVYVYDMEGELVGKVKDNQIDYSNTDITMEVIGDSKIVYLVGDDYRLELIGNDSGTMTYSIDEMNENMEILRTLRFDELPLSNNTVYQGMIFEAPYIDNGLYSLSCGDEVISADTDSYTPMPARIFTTGVDIDITEKSLNVGDSFAIKANVIPVNATNEKINWKSSNESVASVASDGMVKAKNIGSAEISAISDDGKFEKKCTVDVTVKDPNFDPKSMDPTKRFTDVAAGKWYSKPDGPIAYVIANGIMNGTSDTTFDPEGSCTRDMFVQILYNVEGRPSCGSNNPFSDVPNGKWYTKAIIWAYENGVTSGTSATTFGLGGNVTRQQLAQFLMNYAKKRGFDTSARADISGFPDAAKVSGWAAESISWANANSIINGKAKQGVNYLDPKGNATRAEVAQMIMAFQQKFGK